MKLPIGLKFIGTNGQVYPVITKTELGIGDELPNYGDLKIIEIVEREDSYVVIVAGWYDNGNDYKDPEYLKQKFIAKK